MLPSSRRISSAETPTAARNLQQKLQNLNVPLRLEQILSPSVKPVAAQEKAMRAGMRFQDALHTIRQRRHILTVFEDWEPFAMLMRADPVESLQHLEALDREASVTRVKLRQDGAPHRMRMQDGSSLGISNDREVQKSLGGRASAAGERFAILVNLHDMSGKHLALIHSTGAYRHPQRKLLRDNTEIAARSQSPSSRVHLAPKFCKPPEGGVMICHERSLSPNPPRGNVEELVQEVLYVDSQSSDPHRRCRRI